MKKLVWHTEKRKIKELDPYKLNPRKLTEERAGKLKESFERFNVVEIPVIDVDNKILAGHQRAKILQLLGRGEEEIDVRVPNRKLTKEEFAEYNIRSNVSIGDWNFELLKDIDTEVLLDVGLDEATLSNIWGENLSVEDDEFDVEATLAKIGIPKTKPGDLIILGAHRLYCGDGTDPEAVERLVGKHKIDILDYDPIYNIKLDYNKGIGTKGKYGGTVTDFKSDKEYRAFLKSALENGIAHCKPDFHAFCWCDQTYIGLIQSLYEELGINNKRVCLWIKNSQNPTPQVAFNKAFEPCVYGVKGSPYLSSVRNLNEILNKEVATGNRLIDDILDLFDIWLVKRVTGQDYEHPTQKPPTLYEKVLRRCTKPGDILLDLFAGSGSQMAACEQLKRRAFLCEIDPLFCDVVVARYKRLTGKEALYVNQ